MNTSGNGLLGASLSPGFSKKIPSFKFRMSDNVLLLLLILPLPPILHNLINVFLQEKEGAVWYHGDNCLLLVPLESFSTWHIYWPKASTGGNARSERINQKLWAGKRLCLALQSYCQGKLDGNFWRLGVKACRLHIYASLEGNIQNYYSINALTACLCHNLTAHLSSASSELYFSDSSKDLE